MDDVIIVGAGPAGANTALGLTKLGRSVTVIDERIHLGDKVCTGIIGSACVRKYPPGPGMTFGQPTSANVTTANGKTYHFSTEYPQASVIDRVQYVAQFSKEAEALGAKYFLGERVVSIEVKVSCVVVSTSNRKLRGKALVIASGFGTSLLSQVGLQKGNEYMVGSQVEVEVNDMDSVHVYLDSLKTPGFFSWITPTVSNKALVGVIADKASKSKLNTSLKYLKSVGSINRVCGSSRSWGIPLKPIEQTYTNRVLVVGDSAGQIKPITGGGILYSLVCGDIAASVLDSCLEKDDLSENALAVYQVLWKKKIGKEIQSSYSIRKFVEKIPNKIQSQLVKVAKTHTVIEGLIANKGMFDKHSLIFSGMFSNPAISWVFRKNFRNSIENNDVQETVKGISLGEANEGNELVHQ